MGIFKTNGSILGEGLFERPTQGAEPLADSLAAKAPAFFASTGRAPCLEVPREPHGRNFAESAWVLLRGGAPRKFLGGNYFRDCWIAGRTPRGALAGSLAWHLLFVLVLLPLLEFIPARATRIAPPREQLTWYGPASDLPELLPRIKLQAKPRAKIKARLEEPDPAPDPQTEAFHPFLTILNRPARPNHPRQTLIQPAAPAEPPRILPDLPNMVEWDAPSAPLVRIDPAAAAPRRTKRAEEEIAPPEMAAPEVHPSDSQLKLIAAQPEVAAPSLAVSPLASPRARTARAAEESAPNLDAFTAAAPGSLRMIALSAAPAPVAPPPQPLGNLESRLSISPSGGKAGSAGPSAVSAAADAAGSGPPGLSITGARRAASPGAGSSAGLLVRPAARPEVAPNAPARAAASVPHSDVPIRTEPGDLAAKLKAGAKPEALLDASRSHTLQVNMANLTSATGSWILSFAEFNTGDAEPIRYAKPSDLSGPVPVHKVDPQYPPELRSQKIQGDVVLYAVIRRDGSVDSIQLLEGVDPVLDSSAMRALAQWKFRPAERQGAPVELEAIVHIPLHATAPLY